MKNCNIYRYIRYYLFIILFISCSHTWSVTINQIYESGAGISSASFATHHATEEELSKYVNSTCTSGQGTLIGHCQNTETVVADVDFQNSGVGYINFSVSNIAAGDHIILISTILNNTSESWFSLGLETGFMSNTGFIQSAFPAVISGITAEDVFNSAYALSGAEQVWYDMAGPFKRLLFHEASGIFQALIVFDNPSDNYNFALRYTPNRSIMGLYTIPEIGTVALIAIGLFCLFLILPCKRKNLRTDSC